MAYNKQECHTSVSGPLRIMISGKVGEGKTQTLQYLLSALEKKNIPYAAVLAEGRFSKHIREDFFLRLLPENRRVPLCRRAREDAWFPWRNWWFNPEAFEAGSAHLQRRLGKGHILILDEVGQLELEGKGWANLLEHILAGQEAVLITCRDTFSGQVSSRWPARWQKYSPDALPELVDLLKPV